MVGAPRRAPSASIATAACTCLWVSTPTMTSARAVSSMAEGLRASCGGLAIRRSDRTVTGRSPSSSYHVPLDRQVPPGGADTSTRWHGASQGKGQAPRAAPILSQSRLLLAVVAPAVVSTLVPVRLRPEALVSTLAMLT